MGGARNLDELGEPRPELVQDASLLSHTHALSPCLCRARSLPLPLPPPLSHTRCRRWRSNPSGKCSQERLTRGTITSTMCRAAHSSGCARCGAGAGCSAIKYQSLNLTRLSFVRSPRRSALRSPGPRHPRRHLVRRWGALY